MDAHIKIWTDQKQFQEGSPLGWVKIDFINNFELSSVSGKGYHIHKTCAVFSESTLLEVR